MALYRKYRPATFAEVVGQEHVTDPLSTALDTGRISHAYLFSGPRGCGKTSSARILARSLNCVDGPTSTPCGVCPSCVALGPGGAGNLDVIELDAASHGGVDDTRELRDRAFYAPAESRYRVFIVDEAHMVTTAGFNALLKIVEEPPAHLIFIFATTEPDKVLPTIRSRTHHYPFRLLPPATMRGLLGKICEQEHVPVEESVYPLVIRAGGGSPRDSLSVLDQLLAGAGAEGVTYPRAVALLGVTDVALIDDAIDALAADNGAALFGTIDRVMEAGHDPRRFAVDLLERLRDLILLRAVPDAAERGLVSGPGDVIDRMCEQAERIGPATLTRYAELLHEGLGEMRGATAPRLLLEVVCARMLLPSVSDAESATLQRLERLERGFAGGAPARPAPSDTAPAAPADRPAAPQAGTGNRRRGAELLAAARAEKEAAAGGPARTAPPAGDRPPAGTTAPPPPDATAVPTATGEHTGSNITAGGVPGGGAGSAQPRGTAPADSNVAAGDAPGEASDSAVRGRAPADPDLAAGGGSESAGAGVAAREFAQGASSTGGYPEGVAGVPQGAPSTRPAEADGSRRGAEGQGVPQQEGRLPGEAGSPGWAAGEQPSRAGAQPDRMSSLEGGGYAQGGGGDVVPADAAAQASSVVGGRSAQGAPTGSSTGGYPEGVAGVAQGGSAGRGISQQERRAPEGVDGGGCPAGVGPRGDAEPAWGQASSGAFSGPGADVAARPAGAPAEAPHAAQAAPGAVQGSPAAAQLAPTAAPASPDDAPASEDGALASSDRAQTPSVGAQGASVGAQGVVQGSPVGAQVAPVAAQTSSGRALTSPDGTQISPDGAQTAPDRAQAGSGVVQGSPAGAQAESVAAQTSGAVPGSSDAVPAPSAAAQAGAAEVAPTAAAAPVEDLVALVEGAWAEIKGKVREFGPTLQALLSGAAVSRAEGATIVFAHQSPPLAQRLSDPRNIDAVRSAVRSVLGRELDVRWETGTPAPRPAPAAKTAGSPARGTAQGENKPTGRPKFSRPSQAKGNQGRPAGQAKPVADDDIPPPDFPDLPDDPGPDEGYGPDPGRSGGESQRGDAVLAPPTPEEEQEMLAAAAEPVAPGDRQDPDEVALALLRDELGAKSLDG